MHRSFFALLCLITGSLIAADQKQPNIVFFFTDDQTCSTLGCYGNEIIQTPTIDQLAAEGTRYENSFVSHSICWVSRTTILSGLTGRTYGEPGNRELARAEAVEELYSDILRENGYRTGYFGKWHAKMPKGYKAEDHFDEYEKIGRNPFYKEQEDGTLRHATDLIIDRGVDFIKNQPKDKPFSLNLWFNAGHAEDKDRRPGIGHFPWPRSVDGLYEDIEIPAPKLNQRATFDALPDFLKTTINRERFFWRWNTPEKYQANIRAYYRMITGIDNGVARIQKILEEQGLADNTIIVYTADNGYYMGNRGLAGKWSHYEESLRVPLIIFDPRVDAEQRGKVSTAQALNLDLPATFLDWAGLEIPERYQGRSLASTMGREAPPEDWRTDTFHEHFAVRNRIPAFEGIRNDRFKYVRYVDDGNYEFLHDLVKDPDELQNLASDPAFAKVLEKMRARTDERVAELGGSLHAPTKEHSPSTVPHPTASADPLEVNDFVSIFDGKSFRGWEGSKKYWSVKDGALVGIADGTLKRNHFITWLGSTVRNFDLRMKVNITEGGNSGIQYRGTMRPDIGLDAVSGYQCDIVPGHDAYHGMLYEERERRILSNRGDKVVIDTEGNPWVVGSVEKEDIPYGEWVDYRILAEGNHLRHFVNGRMTTEVIDLDAEGRDLEGVLGMQVHVGDSMTVQFKEIRIKHLPDDLALKTAEDTNIPKEATLVRPQMRLPKDWVAPTYGAWKAGEADIPKRP